MYFRRFSRKNSNIRAGKSGQTMQTQKRNSADPDKTTDQRLHCLPIHIHPLSILLHLKHKLLNF